MNREALRGALAIGFNDLRVFLRNRSAWIWLVVMPLLFVFFMGYANRGPGAPGNPRPPVLVDPRDPGFLGAAFLEELGAQGLTLLPPEKAAEAERGVRLGPGFTADILAGRQGTVEVFSVRGAPEMTSLLVEMRVTRALLALNSHLLEHAADHAGAPPTAESLAGLRSRTNPVVLDARFAGRRPIPAGYQLSLPGVMIMYLMMNLLIFGGTAVAAERREGVLRRIASLPVSRGALVAGKVFGLMLLALVQIVLFLLAGRYLFGVRMGDQLPGILLVLAVFAWVAASLGVLVGSVVHSEDKVVGLCLMASLSMAAIGGCWWPLEIVPEGIRTLAHAIPTGWAMDALHQLITFGAGLGAAKKAVAVLAGFGLAANLAAVRWFRV